MTRQTLQRSALSLAFLFLAGCGPADQSADLPASGASTMTTAVPREVETPHFVIATSAGEATGHRAGLALEALFRTYRDFFDSAGAAGASPALRVRLYADRSEFTANNRSRPWAEAYYAQGVCHAYLDQTKPNPYHWLLHEAVHQLNRELTGFAKEQWINEGLATYFGSSRYSDGRLDLGAPDLDTYPLWWLKRWELSGDWATDVQSHRVIPLRTLITGQGKPSLDTSVNAHYLGWWSLTHFLLNHDAGKYAAGYRHLVEHGGSLEQFEQFIGPVEKIEAEWYRHFQGLAAAARDNGQ